MTEPQEPSLPKETFNLGEKTENKANTNQQKLEQELNSPAKNQTQKQPECDETNLDSSTKNDNSEDNQNPLQNLEKDDKYKKKIDLQPSKEQIEPLTNKEKKIVIIGMLTIYQKDAKIFNAFLKAHNLLAHRYNDRTDIKYNEIYDIYYCIHPALTRMEELLDEIKQLRSKEESTKDQYSQLNRNFSWLQRQLANITGLKNDLSQELNNYKTINNQLSQQVVKLKQEVAELEGQKEAVNKNLAEVEASQSRLLAEVARLNQDAGIHYDATSNRPQHHILIDEYKTLKEQHFHFLAVSLFSFMEQSNPELKKQRKAKVNDIKAAISVTVLMHGHEIMKGKSDEVAELPPKLLEEMEDFLSQKLQLNQIISPETKEILKKAVNSAQDKIAYPEPGKWEEEDFKNTSVRISNSLFKLLELNIPDIDENLRDETIKVTKEALHFLERTALAEPPADFNLYEENESFKSDYHEAAKGFDDEGKIIKTIYPVYLVNGEAKVKAIVLTKA